MKIIDLLNKIANGETLPKKICYDDIIYILIDNGIYSWYRDEECDEGFLDNVSNVKDFLNDYVEIIEEPKKIEKIPLPSIDEFKSMSVEERYVITAKEYDLLNELIDEINNLKEK